jgi:hypothetical protein
MFRFCLKAAAAAAHAFGAETSAPSTDRSAKTGGWSSRKRGTKMRKDRGDEGRHEEAQKSRQKIARLPLAALIHEGGFLGVAFAVG